MEVTTARILLVEDDPLDQALIMERLRGVPYLRVDATIAPSIASAQSMIDTGRFDLVLLDYRLPDGTGEALLSWLVTRQRSGPEDVQGDPPADVLMLTGLEDLRIATRIVRAGVFDYLSKAALETEELARAVQAALASRAHRIERQRRVVLELRLQERQALGEPVESNGASLGEFVSLLDAEQARLLREQYLELLRSSIMGEGNHSGLCETLVQTIYRNRVAVEHLIQIHTTLIEELIDQEPVLAQRAVMQGRLALIRVLLALVQRYQRGSDTAYGR